MEPMRLIYFAALHIGFILHCNMTTILLPEIATMTDAIVSPLPRQIAQRLVDGDTRPAALSVTLGSIFRLIAEAMEGASAARARYPLAD
jgi:hypothetical protein